MSCNVFDRLKWKMQVHINTLIIVENTLVIFCSILITLYPCTGGIDSCKGTAERVFHSTNLVTLVSEV